MHMHHKFLYKVVCREMLESIYIKNHLKKKSISLILLNISVDIIVRASSSHTNNDKDSHLFHKELGNTNIYHYKKLSISFKRHFFGTLLLEYSV